MRPLLCGAPMRVRTVRLLPSSCKCTVRTLRPYVSWCADRLSGRSRPLADTPSWRTILTRPDVQTDRQDAPVLLRTHRQDASYWRVLMCRLAVRTLPSSCRRRRTVMTLHADASWRADWLSGRSCPLVDVPSWRLVSTRPDVPLSCRSAVRTRPLAF